MAEQAKLKLDPVGDFYQGGAFCSAEFAGDFSKVWAPK
jgi:uronate dehydrogenase